MSRIVAVVMLAVILLAGATAVDSGYQNAGVETEINNETLSATFGTPLELTYSKRSDAFYSDTIRLYDNQSLLEDGTDYDWYDGNGTVRVYNTSNVEENETLYAYYSFREPTQNQQKAMDIAVAPWDPAPVLIFVMGGAVMLAALRLVNG